MCISTWRRYKHAWTYTHLAGIASTSCSLNYSLPANQSWRTNALYLALKHLHVSTVVLSLALFVLRGLWMLADSPQSRRRWVRIVPHVIDTALLASAVGLVLILHQYPFVHGWLTAKVLGLTAYIILGSIALKRGQTKPIRATAWIMALATFGYIASVAITHSPSGFLPWLL
ncbi:MAG: SirB2 family protein [Candidatus Competibacteraceae bacterium]|nr:MAG: SirB2 family protein [Candidatus Competibacteraceae bacterium]